MTLLRIQELEKLGFEWDGLGTAWEDRLSELGISKSTGTAMFLSYSENSKSWLIGSKTKDSLQVATRKESR
jgi:hypothetical protein